MTDEPFLEALIPAIASLDAAGIPYAITGSVASSIHGEPIPSQDVDIAIRMTPQQARQLEAQLPQRFYRNSEHLVQISQKAGMSNLIDAGTGLKIDLSVLARTPFFDSVMARRTLTAFGPGGPSFFVVTPEDVILMKLLWRKDSRSDKQWANALSVARVRGATLDWKYLFDHARTLGVEDDLIQLRDVAGI
jgi:hypothetical protein